MLLHAFDCGHCTRVHANEHTYGTRPGVALRNAAACNAAACREDFMNESRDLCIGTSSPSRRSTDRQDDLRDLRLR